MSPSSEKPVVSRNGSDSSHHPAGRHGTDEHLDDPPGVITLIGRVHRVSFFSERGTHLIADVFGYFTATTAPG